MGVGVGGYVLTFILGGSFKVVMFGCVYVYGCVGSCGFVSGLWCPSMRMGDFVGVQGGGSWGVNISGRGRVRWGLIEVFLIGESEIDSCGFGGCCGFGCGGVCQ